MFKLKATTELKTRTINGLDQVVTELPFVYQVNKDGLDNTVLGDPLKLNAPAKSGFVPYSSLTEEIINNWIEENLTEDQKTFYRSLEEESRKKAMEETPVPPQIFSYNQYTEITESPLPF